jgi:hypothetical protein
VGSFFLCFSYRAADSFAMLSPGPIGLSPPEAYPR